MTAADAGFGNAPSVDVKMVAANTMAFMLFMGFSPFCSASRSAPAVETVKISGVAALRAFTDAGTIGSVLLSQQHRGQNADNQFYRHIFDRRTTRLAHDAVRRRKGDRSSTPRRSTAKFSLTTLGRWTISRKAASTGLRSPRPTITTWSRASCHPQISTRRKLEPPASPHKKSGGSPIPPPRSIFEERFVARVLSRVLLHLDRGD